MSISRWRLAAATAAALLALSGCGAPSEDGVATAGGGGPAPAASQDQALAFAQCMRSNGLPDFPDPGPEGGSGLRGLLQDSTVDREAAFAALEACRDLMPSGVTDRLQDPAVQEQLLRLAACMREHGVDMPDPDPNGGLGAAFGLIDPDDPTFQAAVEACRDTITLRGDGQP